jgi:glycolate oxidase FAD binding subunit
VLEHEPGDLTCVVDSGLRVSQLQAALASHGQRLSLDPPHDPTLGDCLLFNLSGPLQHRFGTMRDLVIGVTVVLQDGLRASSGGKVVKNVAGYDLGKLFCGSGGHLGQVERLALRLHPLPAASRTVALDGDRWHDLHNSYLVPSAVDLANNKTYVLFEGAAASVERQLADLGGEEANPWDELRELQAGLAGRVRWDGGPAPLIRPGPRVAYQAEQQAWHPFAERVVEALGSGTL